MTFIFAKFSKPIHRICLLKWSLIAVILHSSTTALCITADAIRNLREETVSVFYHGFSNYLEHAFPEDELRPLSCRPLTRDRDDPANFGINDVLGNYSLTLIDSLSTLAILASTPTPTDERNKALEDFQDSIALLVEYYGDGTDGTSGEGKRAKGFELDSKVQVFETVIRGLGGLLSAHLFAIGELPIRGYDPQVQQYGNKTGILWRNGLIYDGQMLRLAYDLGVRLLPAFATSTGIPYPRVNLKTGIPFYINSLLSDDAETGQCEIWPPDTVEVTETCSAGAGSLVLEMSTLSRLTGDDRFANAAETAFWAIWDRRSSAGLIGAGIDAETGQWLAPFTGIGAGIDSFFEYAFKSYILLSGVGDDADERVSNKSEAFLSAWKDAHASIRRHVYRGPVYQHPHYIQADLYNGATRALWIDSLSAYYPGLLTLAGELEEAIEGHLLHAALWARYSALPERWSVASGNVEHGLRWWGGRPEFIESTWYLYQATKDPWYLHAGEMALKDIKRRCWARCGWAGLQDVRTGEQSDRMESFFLGETVKYLFLLFDPSHPLNKFDAPYVFTTEGHPLVIPRHRSDSNRRGPANNKVKESQPISGTCPLPPPSVPLSFSAVAARHDLFHAASLARLDFATTPEQAALFSIELTTDHPSLAPSSSQSPSNYTFFPWTIPLQLIPPAGLSSKMTISSTFDLSFPTLPNAVPRSPAVQRVEGGVSIRSMSGLRLRLVREPQISSKDADGAIEPSVRIFAVSNVALGRDEYVVLPRKLAATMSGADPYFTRARDVKIIDLVVDSLISYEPWDGNTLVNGGRRNNGGSGEQGFPMFPSHAQADNAVSGDEVWNLRLDPEGLGTSDDTEATIMRTFIPAVLPLGPGAAPLPDVDDFNEFEGTTLPWTSIYFSDETCRDRLPKSVPMEHQIIVMKRGECSFSRKLRNIPGFVPSSKALQLVILVSYPEHETELEDLDDAESSFFVPGASKLERSLIRPLLDELQYTPTGIPRLHPISMVMISGGEETYNTLKTTKYLGIRRRWHFLSQGLKIGNLLVT